MRTARRWRLIATIAFCGLLPAGCRESPPASGSATFAAPSVLPGELPDTPSPLEELGTPAQQPDTAPAPAPTGGDDEGSDKPEAADPAQPPEGTEEVSLTPLDVPGEVTASSSWTSFRNGPQLLGIADCDLPAEPQLLWEISTVNGSASTPAILNGRVFMGTLDGYVLCLNLRDGNEIWHYRTIESTDPEEFAPGFNAPATVSDRAVFLGDDDGTFHAIDRETGEQLWFFETQGEIVGGATLLPGNRVMFGSHDGHLYCLAADTGEVVWQFETLGPVNGSQAVTPNGNHGAVIAPVPETLYTFVTGCDKPTLRVVNTESGEQEMEIPLGDALLIASPGLAGDILYFGSASGEVFAIDWRDENTLWKYADPDHPDEMHSSPAVTDEVVIIGSRDRRMHCIDRETGESRWAFETRGAIDGSPVVVGDRVFFGSNDRNLYAVNISDGSRAWQYQVGQRISGSAAVAEGCLVIAASDRGGKILCFGTP